MRWRRAALALVALLLSACSTPAAEVTQTATGWHGTPAPAFTPAPGTWQLSTGETVSTEDLFDAPLTLVFFGFTHCDDICPLTLSRVAAALRRVDDADQVRVVMVTTDPARDTPEVLAEFLRSLDPTFIGVTADRAALHRLADSLNVTFSDEHPDVVNYQVEHSSALLGLQQQGDTMVWTGSGADVVAIQDLADDLNALLTEK